MKRSWRNIGLFVFCIFLSTIMWVTVKSEKLIQKVYTIRINRTDFIKLPENIRIVDYRPQTMNVTLQGQQSFFLQQDIGQLVSVLIDASNLKNGENIITLKTEDIQIQTEFISQLKLVDINKGDLLVTAEAYTKEVEIRPDISGEVAEGYKYNISWQPETVMITGSPAQLEKIEYISTQKIDISGRTSGQKVNSLILYGNISPFEPVERAVVMISVEQKMKTKRISGIPIEYRGLGDGLTANLQTKEVLVEFKIPESYDFPIEREDFLAQVDLSNLGAATYKCQVKVIPPNIAEIPPDSIKVTPEAITVNIANYNNPDETGL
jgi:YbbR domain-containing protein